MKLPKTIQVLGRNWTIKLLDEIIDSEGVECEGLCEYSTKTISILSSLKGAHLVEVYIHEWLHAVWSETGIYEEDVPYWVEHMIVCAVSKEMAGSRGKWKEFFKLWG